MADRKMKHVWMVEDAASDDAREQRSFWTKIGVAYENADGSWSLQLSAVPVSGKMQLRDPALPSRAAQPPPTIADERDVSKARSTSATLARGAR